MKKHLLGAAALTAIALAPAAQAQLLSGSGLGQVTGSVVSVTHGTTGTLRSTTRGTLRGETRTRGSENVDRRSGEVSLERSFDTGVTATALGFGSLAKLGQAAKIRGAAGVAIAALGMASVAYAPAVAWICR